MNIKTIGHESEHNLWLVAVLFFDADADVDIVSEAIVAHNLLTVNTALTYNKKTYTAKTNSKGVATFKITKLTKKGKYTATIKYAGSSYYNAKTVKPKITVK